MPTQLRMPVAKMRPFLPCGSKARTSARLGFVSPCGAERMTDCHDCSSRRVELAHSLGDIGAGPDRHIHDVVRPARTPRRACGDRRSADAGRRPRPGRAPSGRRCGRGNGRRNRCCRRRPIADRGRADRTRCRTGQAGRRRTPSGCVASPPLGRSTRMRPAALSATNTSPFGADADDARRREAGSKQVDFKAVWDDWLLLVGAVHYFDDIPYRLGKIGRRQVLRPDQPPRPRTVGAPVAKCGRALEKTGARLGEKRDDGEETIAATEGAMIAR